MYAITLPVLAVLLGASANTATDLPKVIVGDAHLECTISATNKGLQRLMITDGGGLSFQAQVNPLSDGVVEQRGKDLSAVYSFTSSLSSPAKGHLSGVGDVTIPQLTTRVSVEVKRYEQNQPGEPLRFKSEDISGKDIYVEFSGIAIAGEARYRFNVNMGPVQSGNGTVEPMSANFKTGLRQKSVEIQARTTTVVAREK